MDNTKKKVLKLKNGIKVLVVPMPTDLTDISVRILLGQNHEKPHEMEITHYMEHLMGRFTSKKYPDHKIVSKELYKRGAITNASVDEYETKFWIQGFYKDLEFYMDLLSNTIKDFYIDKHLAKKEKNAVIQELRNYMSDNEYTFDMKIWNYMYKKYAYQNDFQKHIGHIKKYRIENIHKFIHEHVLLHNTVVSITCPTNKVANTIKLAKKYFNMPNKNKKAKIKFPLYQYNNKPLKVLFIKNQSKTDDNVLFRLVVDDSIEYLSVEHLSLMYLKEILFKFETGIFYKILRDKLGYIYHIQLNMYVDMVNPLSSYYYIETSVNHKILPKFIAAVLDIIKNLQLTNDEINNGKTAFLVKNEFKKFNNLTSYNRYYSQYLLHKLPIVERSVIKEKLMKVSNASIIKTLNKFKKDVFKEGLIFYYAQHNMNSAIKNVVSHQIKYITL
jgi:predicted Zn-dependent peptidase